MTTITDEIEAEPAASRPLPVLEIREPAAVRGIPEIRKHLDGPRCALCGVPVAEDEQMIRVDVWGKMARRHVCKGHTEHPRSFLRGTQSNPTDARYCVRCGGITTSPKESGRCLGCEVYETQGELMASLTPERKAKVLEAGDRDE